jgi:hypothetical protein
MPITTVLTINMYQKTGVTEHVTTTTTTTTTTTIIITTYNVLLSVQYYIPCMPYRYNFQIVILSACIPSDKQNGRKKRSGKFNYTKGNTRYDTCYVGCTTLAVKAV